MTRAELPTRRIGALVFGRVQGVAFRAHTRHRARQLGLAGWVRNLPDGSVELEAHGDAARVDELLAWLAVGPPAARVTEVRLSELERTEPERGDAAPSFEIRY